MKYYSTPELLHSIRDSGLDFSANSNIAEFLDDNKRASMAYNVEQAVSNLLDALLIDTENDHNTRETHSRVAKMFLTEVFKGRYVERPDITEFPNAKNLDEMYIVGPITIRSTCSHHLVPITGHAWCGVLPSDKVIGLSKFNRLVDWVMSRPHIQEEASIMIADEIETLIKPKGLGLVVKATHMCMTHRGVKEHSTAMTNSIMRGEFRNNPSVRSEFLDLIKAHGFLK